MINRDKFFAGVRTRIFAGHISQGQFDGLTRILAEWDRRALTDLRWLAYMLATVFHETSQTMQPVREGGGEAYLRSKVYYPWVGEGLVQVTWETNHRKFGATKPGQLMTWPIALRALFDGMIKGMFTTKKLADYFSGAREDWTGARKIINGTDRAELIAGYGRSFHAAIKAAYEPAPAPKVSTAAKAGAGAIVVATAGAASGHDWIGGDHWMTYLIIGIGFALVLLLGLVAALAKKPETIVPSAPSPLDLPKEGWKPAPGPTAPRERLKAGLGKLSSLGSAWIKPRSMSQRPAPT
jgi:hypothetical protein